MRDKVCAAWGALAVAIALPTAAAAQRADENVVTAAEDAFGTSIGRETIGLYSSSSVRGFSPVAAGNARMDGLYFDQVWGVAAQLRRSTSIRVGLTALGFPFPAPTGVVDFALRKPGDTLRASAFTEANSDGAAVLELDATVPLARGKLSLNAAVGLTHSESYDGTDYEQHVEAVSLLWRPIEQVEVAPFWVRSDLYDDQVGPIYVPAGAHLPPKVARRRYDGPDWATYRGAAINYGVLASAKSDENWLVRGGLFRSLFDDDRNFANLLLDVTPGGEARRLIVADPAIKIASTSGELRVTRSHAEGPRLHVLHVSVRGRDRTRRYGGSDEIDLGATQLGQAVSAPKPDFVFGEQTRDRVRQWTGGVAYEGRWRNVGEISASLQKTDYRKRIVQPGTAPAETKASPWLYNVTVALQMRPDLVAYAGYTRGLEESGVAPNSAANRNEALPAIETSQRDAGLRWRVTPNLTLVGGLFDVRKPYFNLDEANRFALLGDVRHQGVEVSLAGKVRPNLNVVAGAVLMRPRVTGEGVRLGRVGERPVGQPERTFNLNLDWRPDFSDRFSVDLRVSHVGPVAATRDNRVKLPSRTLVDLGARYRFKAAGNPTTLRVAVTNLFNEYAFELRGSGAYDLWPGRILSASLAMDF